MKESINSLMSLKDKSGVLLRKGPRKCFVTGFCISALSFLSISRKLLQRENLPFEYVLTYPLLPPSLTQFNVIWIFLFHLPISLAKSLLQSGSIHNVQKLSNIKTTAINNGNFTKLRIQEPKPPLSTASTIKLLYVKQDLAPSGP